MGSITVSNLGKAYKQYPARWARLLEWLDPRGKSRHQLHWVLQDINFTVDPGETVGIIGINGAGKSTLLKMITGTTQPTTGSVHVTGRVAALLELGMGFHPDFTGRQNAIMAAQLLGLDVEEVGQLMPAIENFADVGDYFDQPTRVYSSGMLARVAFSVATAVRPDVLIVDEALSVGDMAFQAKCMQRMNSLRESGVTVLFVSHALNQIRQFCGKALYIKNGLLHSFGEAGTVCDKYQNDLAGTKPQSEPTCNLDRVETKARIGRFEQDNRLRAHSVDETSGSMELSFSAFQVLDECGRELSACHPGASVVFKACISANSDVPAGAAVGLLIADKTGYPLLSCNSNYYSTRLPDLRRGDRAIMTWRLMWPFYSGELRVDIGIKPDPFSSDFYDRVFCAKTIACSTPVALLKENFGGFLHVHADVEVTAANG
ncbi:MAG: ABC transporter ATP-binding protein [Gammaproteobacteria bacterium]|nr:ABC transporter ATP-binding protein [Gammaproteobacteria bacterium]MBU1415553.1 ABC transporter ATP-binding protein [Gammaproteobacteria bacterium]